MSRESIFAGLSVGLLVAIVILVVAPAESPPTADDVPPNTTSVAPSLPSPTSPEPPVTVEPADSGAAVEPVVQQEVRVTDDDTVVLVDLRTRETIWESRPMTDPTLLRVGGGTLSVRSGEHSVVLSMVDGTQLPP